MKVSQTFAAIWLVGKDAINPLIQAIIKGFAYSGGVSGKAT